MSSLCSKKYIKPIYYDTLIPYQEIDYHGIQYTVCRDFDNISRYRGLRQIVHDPNESTRYITLETQNTVTSNAKFEYYDVPLSEENRLDLISNRFFGSPQYSWVISYFNDIEDGYTVHEGQRLRILKNITALFNSGELLAPISAMQMNLGTE